MSSNVCWICGNAHGKNEPCGEISDQRVGTLLEGKYQISRILGEGGMGKVYEGQHQDIGRRVAIKFLLPEFASKPEIVRRFVNEARTAGGLEHENIAAVHDFGRTPDGACYLVMDLLNGEDCSKLLSREGPLPVKRAVGILLQICRGLDVAHRAGIVHRDLKPANLFLTKRADRSEWVRILDFGIAKLQTNEAESITATGCPMGTPYYMSPEQARGDKSVDHRTDVYALGVILYELLSGKRPHEGTTLSAILLSIMHNDPPPLESLRAGLPRDLVQLVRKAMNRAPEKRYASVADLGQALIPHAGMSVAPFQSQPLPAVPVDPYGETADGGNAASVRTDQTASTTAPLTPKSSVGLGAAVPSKARWVIGLGTSLLVALVASAVRLIGGHAESAPVAAGSVQSSALPSAAGGVGRVATSSLSAVPRAASEVSGQPLRPDVELVPITVEPHPQAPRGANKSTPASPRSEKPKDNTPATATAVAPAPVAQPAAPPVQLPAPKQVDIQREPNF